MTNVMKLGAGFQRFGFGTAGSGSEPEPADLERILKNSRTDFVIVDDPVGSEPEPADLERILKNSRRDFVIVDDPVGSEPEPANGRWRFAGHGAWREKNGG